jgi:hypothetical protein
MLVTADSRLGLENHSLEESAVVSSNNNLPKLKLKSLFDFSFFVNDMFTNNGIKFLDLHFFGHSALVFGRGIKVPRAFGRNQFNFIAHNLSP